LCEGGELFDRIDEYGCFNEDKARNIFVQMVKTVKYLHLQKICHRDLKAENFLFSRSDDDYIMLIDFGLSFQWKENMKEELEASGNNKIVGTSYYVSPEILAKNYDEQCDVWALGVLLHVITTATAPFPGETDQDILQKIKNNPYQESNV
jgi:calcium-dependent protein kinase